MSAAIEFVGFSLAHRRDDGEDRLLADVNLTLARGGFYLFVGSSGGGKSSLLRLLAGLNESREPPPAIGGTMRIFGRDLDEHARHGRVAAILQDEGLLDELSPRANVELALRHAERSIKLAPALLAQAGIPEPPERTSQLSGGMRKRVAVARALASTPELLLCDEPTAGLDPQAARDIARLLREAHDADPGRTTLVVTHDIAAFEGLVDGVLVLDRGAASLELHRTAPETLPKTAQANDAGEASPLHGLRRVLLRSAAVVETFVESLRRLPPVELGETVRTTARCMLEPTPFVALCGAVIGGLAMFFGLRNNPVEGGFETAILTGTGKVCVAVLVPLLSGFFFTARVVAGSAARLGTMKRTNQIAALVTMGIRPADYLLTPLVWGMALAMPVVTLVGVVAASFAAAVAAAAVSGFSTTAWAQAWFATVDAGDVLVLLAKSTLSGYLVALTCYHLGTGPKRSSRDVGEAVNTAIVYGMALVLAVHAVLTFVAYV
ncbi:MAG: hypothetical protein RL398_1388 [Planctomycetota bacterium]|jgi:ABC-type multidrug transport system ATPase subunit/ABC-type transporter Mla maintaining outer membrane lipid asymmetry permease subunit MlaE